MRTALALRGPNARSSEMKLASHSILPAFEFFLKQRGRRWLWSVHTAEGTQVVTGSGCSRSAAAYEANRALFLLLLSARRIVSGLKLTDKLGGARLRLHFNMILRGMPHSQGCFHLSPRVRPRATNAAVAGQLRGSRSQ